VAYLPGDSLRAGWRVVAEWSRGWSGPTLPFWKETSWELSRVSSASPGHVLYIEGNAGPIEVWQAARLLYWGADSVVWVPLVESRQALLRLRSEGKSGILGGIYLLARADTQAWPAEPYPPPPLCKASSQAACLCLPFVPPAHRQVALQKAGQAWKVGRCDQPTQPSPAPLTERGPLISTVALVGWALLARFLPRFRASTWKGFFHPLPADPLENLLGGLWVAFLLSCWLEPALVGLAVGFLGVEALLLARLGAAAPWSWQSWLLPLLLLWPLEWGVGPLSPLWVYGAWLARLLRFALYNPYFAYLCLAEYFVYLLLRPA